MRQKDVEFGRHFPSDAGESVPARQTNSECVPYALHSVIRWRFAGGGGERNFAARSHLHSCNSKAKITGENYRTARHK